MDNTIKTSYLTRDYIKKSDRKKLIKSMIQCDGYEKMIDCYDYSKHYYSAISISKQHIVWNYEIDFSEEYVTYTISLMTKKYHD